MSIQARLALSDAAARAATLGAHDQAVAYLRSAALITTDPADRVGLLTRAAASAYAAARHLEAKALLTEAVTIADAIGDPAAVGTAQALMAEILIDNGEVAEAASLLEDAVVSYPAGAPDEVLAALLCNLSRVFMRSSQYLRAIEAADRALAIAERRGLDRIVAEALNNKGSSLGDLGRRRESIALLRAAVDVAREGGFVDAETRALSNLGVSTDDLHVALEAAVAAERLALRVGNRATASWAQENIRFLNYMMADGWDAATSEPEGEPSGSAFDGSIGSPLDQLRHLAMSAIFMTARGESTDDLLERVQELANGMSDRYADSAVHSIRSMRALAAGDPITAYDEAMLAATEDDAEGFEMAAAARAALRARDVERAQVVADLLDARPGSDRRATAHRIAVGAGIAALEGRVAVAVAGYRDAIARYRSIGADMWAALGSLDFVLLVGPNHPATVEAVAEARVTFERVAATHYLDELVAASANASVPGHPRVAGQLAVPVDAR